MLGAYRGSMSRSLPAVLGVALAAGLSLAAALATPNFTTRTDVSRTATRGDGVRVSLQVTNPTGSPVPLSLRRNSKQECAFAPEVRVLAVGTKDVIYPNGEPRICTQEIREETVPANGSVTFDRTLKLPAGEYMVEVWMVAFVGDEGVRTKIAGDPKRVTVK